MHLIIITIYLVDLLDDKNKFAIIDSISYQTADSAAGKQGGATSGSLLLSSLLFLVTTAYVQAEFNIDRRRTRLRVRASRTYRALIWKNESSPTRCHSLAQRTGVENVVA